MPIEYTIEKEGAVVIARAIGVLTLDCFMSWQKVIKIDPHLQYPHDTLFDMRFVSKIELKEEDLYAIVQGLTSGSQSIGANRLAIVSIDRKVLNLSQKYETIDKGINETLIVFATYDIAKIWLGLD